MQNKGNLTRIGGRLQRPHLPAPAWWGHYRAASSMLFHNVNDSRKIPCFAPVGHKLRTPRFQSLNPSFQNSNPSLQSSNPLFSTPSLMCSRPESSNLVCSIKPIEQKTSTKSPSSHLPSGSWGNPEFVQGLRIGALPGQNWPRVPGLRPCQARIGLGFEDLGPASPQLA